MAKRRRKNLLSYAEKYAISLLSEATGGSIGPAAKLGEKPIEHKLDFGDRRALLDSITKLIGMRNKVDPEEEDADGIDEFRKALSDDDSGKNSSGGSEADNSTDTFESLIGNADTSKE